MSGPIRVGSENDFLDFEIDRHGYLKVICNQEFGGCVEISLMKQSAKSLQAWLNRNADLVTKNDELEEND